MAAKLLTLECKHQMKMPSTFQVWVNSSVKCPKCKTMKKVIAIKA